MNEQERLYICFKCPLFSKKFGGVCNNKLWLNVKTGDISLYEKDGYQRGCGCLIESKIKNKNAKCPLNKW